MTPSSATIATSEPSGANAATGSPAQPDGREPLAVRQSPGLLGGELAGREGRPGRVRERQHAEVLG